MEGLFLIMCVAVPAFASAVGEEEDEGEKEAPKMGRAMFITCASSVCRLSAKGDAFPRRAGAFVTWSAFMKPSFCLIRLEWRAFLLAQHTPMDETRIVLNTIRCYDIGQQDRVSWRRV